VPGTGPREARERALGLLYEAEMKHQDPLEVLDQLAVPPDPYCAELLRLVDAHRADALARIEAASEHWPLKRMGVVDRLVMVLALCELLGPDAPPKAVVLDEAVELAKTFSTEASGSFVNGILSAATA
jgi:transcription antitermination protein NusB